MASVQGVVGVLETVLSAISVNISASVLIMLTRVTLVSPVTHSQLTQCHHLYSHCNSTKT